MFLWNFIYVLKQCVNELNYTGYIIFVYLIFMKIKVLMEDITHAQIFAKFGAIYGKFVFYAIKLKYFKKIKRKIVYSSFFFQCYRKKGNGYNHSSTI